jgi:hypothetical protein
MNGQLPWSDWSALASALGLGPTGQAHLEVGQLVAHFFRLSAVEGSVEMIAQSWIRFNTKLETFD